VSRPPLPDLQARFWNSIAAEPARHSYAADFVAMVRGVDQPDRNERIGVYADAYFMRLRDVLAEDYPRVAAILGSERFEELARDYLRLHPSEHPSVRYLGRALADFIARLAMPHYLADLAALEWARLEVFDAPDETPLTMDVLRGIAPERWAAMRLRPIAALITVRSRWPVHELWAGAAPEAIAPTATTIRVWRAPDYRVLHAPMDASESGAFQKMLAGDLFAVICQCFADLPELDAACGASALIARWLEDGIIAQVELF
jgi:hypothetical protein